MQRSTLPRLVLTTMLATGVGVATEVAAASASASARHSTAVVAKKKKAKATVKIATTNLGKILVAGNGKTLYALDADGTDITKSNCTDGCATVWPPLKGKGKLKAGKGLDATLLKLGGGKQVAYNGHLLYFFVGKAKGDTSGQGVAGFHVVGADGNPIK
jgi:predicted lipoprotein with Yx(FWY)xxD motif